MTQVPRYRGSEEASFVKVTGFTISGVGGCLSAWKTDAGASEHGERCLGVLVRRFYL